MFITDIAVQVNHLYPTIDHLSADDTPDELMLQTLRDHIIHEIRQSSCRVINICGADNAGMNCMLRIIAARAGWTVLAPKRQAAPLEQLIFGAGFRITESTIARLAAQTSTIVIDNFDRVKSKREILSACGSAPCKSILITTDEIKDHQFSDAHISRYLCIDITQSETPPLVREIVVNR